MNIGHDVRREPSSVRDRDLARMRALEKRLKGIDTHGVGLRKYEEAFSTDGGTTHAITHNLKTQAFTWSVYAPDGTEPDCTVTRNGINDLTITFASAPASGSQFVITVIG